MVEAEQLGVKNEKRAFGIFLAANLIIGFIAFFLLKNYQQTIAITIFIATVIGTLMFWRFRLGIAAIGISLLLITGTIDVPHVVEFMSVDVIIFLVGMMILVGLLRDVGFFAWFMAKSLKISGLSARGFYVILLCLSSLMAALVDEVTSILFITAIILEFCKTFDVDPVNYIIMAVLATNVGSSATVLGNPIGILIAFRAKLGFEDFIRWATPVSVASLVLLIIIGLFWFRKDLSLLQEKMNNSKKSLGEVSLEDPQKMKLSAILFIVVIVVIGLHLRIEQFLRLEKNTVILVASLAGAGAVMIWQRRKARDFVEKDVDWWTLIFFMFLFAKAGTLQYTGITDIIGKSMASLVGKDLVLAIPVVLWVSAWGSSVLDNVVLVAAFIPIVQNLGELGLNNFPLWWALLFGGAFGGNITMVGSTANIVALGILEKKRHFTMTFFRWFKIGLVGGVVPVIVGQILLTIQIPLMGLG